MDPLTAFSLAGTVIQVVDFSSKLVITIRDISQHGTKASNEHIESQTKILQSLYDDLKLGLDQRQTGLSTDDQNLLELCKQSQDVSTELLDLMTRCKVKDKGHGISLDLLWSAVKSEWNESAIKDLQHRLDTIDRRAHTMLTKNYSMKILDRLDQLDGRMSILGTSRSQEIRDIKQSLQELNATRKAVPGSGEARKLLLEAARNGALSRDRAVEAYVLNSLRFEEDNRRVNDLEQRPAHERSYLWLDDAGTGSFTVNQTPANFVPWLSSSSNLYWISGKPGSGKSTLIRFLYERRETNLLLNSWAAGGRLIMASYFFWQVGKVELLRSREGLLRTILFQVFCQQPDLIGEVYRDLWPFLIKGSEVPQDHLVALAGFEVDTSWHDLLKRLRDACEILARSNTRLCLFIDGLDEYEGRAIDIVDMICGLQGMSHVKLCISSRPDNVFLDAFGSIESKLYMEDYNERDIEAHVRGTLESDNNFQKLEDKKSFGEELIRDIVKNAKGVFLWVALVLEEMKEGFRNGDTAADLQRRLRRIPKELEPFFMHILDAVDEFYHQKSAETFAIALAAHDLLPTLSYWFISEGSTELEAERVAQTTDWRTNRRRREDIRKRLNTYCRGLLYIQHMPLPPDQAELSSSTLFSDRVNFLHRTVPDFLRTSEPQALFAHRMSKTFDPNEMICKAILSQIATSPVEKEYFTPNGPISGLLSIFDYHASKMDPGVAMAVQSRLRTILLAQSLENGHGLIELNAPDTVGGASLGPSTIAPTSEVDRAKSSRGKKTQKFLSYFKPGV